MRERKRTKPQKGSDYYRQMWRIVDGAVADAFRMHPDYLARREKTVRESINKRVVGALIGYVGELQRGAVPVKGPAAVTVLPTDFGSTFGGAELPTGREAGVSWLRVMWRRAVAAARRHPLNDGEQGI